MFLSKNAGGGGVGGVKYLETDQLRRHVSFEHHFR